MSASFDSCFVDTMATNNSRSSPSKSHSRPPISLSVASSSEATTSSSEELTTQLAQMPPLPNAERPILNDDKKLAKSQSEDGHELVKSNCSSIKLLSHKKRLQSTSNNSLTNQQQHNNSVPQILSVTESMLIESPMITNNHHQLHHNYAAPLDVVNFNQVGHRQRAPFQQQQQQQQQDQHQRQRNSNDSGMFLYTKFDALYQYIKSMPDEISFCDEFRSYQFWKCVRTEFLASFLFVVLTSQLLITTQYTLISLLTNTNHLTTNQRGSTIMSEHPHNGRWFLLSSGLINGIFQAFTVASLIQIFGNISGAHIVPSISLALLVRRHISTTRFACYLFAQLLGSLIGVTLLWALTASIVVDNNNGTTMLNMLAVDQSDNNQASNTRQVAQMQIFPSNGSNDAVATNNAMYEKFNHDFSPQIRFLRAKRSEANNSRSLAFLTLPNKSTATTATASIHNELISVSELNQIERLPATIITSTTTSTTIAPPKTISGLGAIGEPEADQGGSGSELILLSILDQLHSNKLHNNNNRISNQTVEQNSMSGLERSGIHKHQHQHHQQQQQQDRPTNNSANKHDDVYNDTSLLLGIQSTKMVAINDNSIGGAILVDNNDYNSTTTTTTNNNNNNNNNEDRWGPKQHQHRQQQPPPIVVPILAVPSGSLTEPRALLEETTNKRGRKRRFIGSAISGGPPPSAQFGGLLSGGPVANLLSGPSTLTHNHDYLRQEQDEATSSGIVSREKAIISMIDYALPPSSECDGESEPFPTAPTIKLATGSSLATSGPLTNQLPAVASKSRQLFNDSQLFGFQFLANLLLVLTYLANVEPNRHDLGFKSLSIGLAYFVGSAFTSLSGGLYAHPFQLMSLALFAQRWCHRWFVYLITPILGGLIAAFTYEYLEFSSLANREKSHYLRRSFRFFQDIESQQQRPPPSSYHSMELIANSTSNNNNNNQQTRSNDIQLIEQQQRQNSRHYHHHLFASVNSPLQSSRQRYKLKRGSRAHVRAASSSSSLNEPLSDMANCTDIDLSPLSSSSRPLSAIDGAKEINQVSSGDLQLQTDLNNNNVVIQADGITSSTTKAPTTKSHRLTSGSLMNGKCSKISDASARSGTSAHLYNLRQSNFDENFIISDQGSQTVKVTVPQLTPSVASMGNNNKETRSLSSSSHNVMVPFLGQSANTSAINY